MKEDPEVVWREGGRGREDPEVARRGREDPEVIRRVKEDPEVVRREAAVITELRRQVAGQQGKFVKVGRGGGGERGQGGKQRQRGDRTQNNAQPAAAETRPSKPRPGVGGGQPSRSASADPHHQRQWILRIPEAGRDRDGGHQLRRDSWRLSSSDLSEADSWADKRRVTHWAQYYPPSFRFLLNLVN